MLLDHTVGILTRPGQEWRVIRDEHRSKSAEFLTHAPLMALLPTVCFYIGVTNVGWSIAGGEPVFLTTASAFVLCLSSYVAALLGVWLFGEFINWMSSTYSDQEVDPHHGMAMAVYVTMPLFLSGVIGLYPALWANAVAMVIAGAYSIYLVYEGIPILMNIDKDRAFLYSSSIITVALVLLVSLRIGSVLVWGMFICP